MLIDELQYRIFGEYVPAKSRARRTLARTTTLGLSSQQSLAEAQPTPPDREVPAAPPTRSPFEGIRNLEQSLTEEAAHAMKGNKNAPKAEEHITLADYMMTREQYLKIYSGSDINDANVLNRKLM